MPIRTRFDPALGVLFATGEGVVTFEELMEHLEHEIAENVLGVPELFDATTASTNLTTGQVKDIVRRVREVMREVSIGPTIIVARNDRLFGMARTFALLCGVQGGPQVAVFREAKDGLEWLLHHPRR